MTVLLSCGSVGPCESTCGRGTRSDKEYYLTFFVQQELIEHLEDQNVDAYTEAVKTYDSISRLDQWYTTMLVRIKKQINDNPDLR